MKLYEYQAKEVLRGEGIPFPRGRVCRTPEEAVEAAGSLGGKVYVKAQVLAGGRGKAGGVRPAEDPRAAGRIAEEMLSSPLRGLPVEAVLVEEAVEVQAELYLALAVDTLIRRPVLLASARGGMEVEEVPEKEIFRLPVLLPWGLLAHQCREAGKRIGLSGSLLRQFQDLVLALWRAFRRWEAELAELNPLAVTPGGLLALDARFNPDDDALFRHPELPRTEERTPLERRVAEVGLSFVELEGDIAVLANGAGMAMATMDLLERSGGRPRNFLDVGGGAESEPIARALELLSETHPRVFLVNIFGGITRCDEVARAILAAGLPPEKLVVRLTGTREEEGRSLLEERGIRVFSGLREAVEEAVRRVHSGG